MIFQGEYAVKDGLQLINSTQYIRKEDILSNRGSLGRMQKVFIHYVPTVKPITGEIEGKLEKRIYNFSLNLITYGFDVRVDLFCDKSTRFDRAAWSDRELSQADWVIFVCSRSSYELYQLSNNPATFNTASVDRKRLNNINVLRKIIYNQLSIDTSRVIPVILLEEDYNIAFVPPSIRDSNNIFCIFEDTPFDYDNMGGNLERIICQMAGINRVTINTSGQRRGYVKLASQIPQYTETQQIQSENQSSTHRQAKDITTSPMKCQGFPKHFYQQHNPPQQSVSQSSQQTSQHAYPTDHSTKQFTQHHPLPQQHFRSQPRNEVHATHSQQYHTQDPYGMQYSSKMSSERLNRADGLSDHRIPHTSPILWELSQDVREWKFLARNLDLEERVIDEIDQYTVPNKMRDKSLKVFTEWVNSASRPSWRALGEALLEAEYVLLYERLLELIRKHTV